MYNEYPEKKRIRWGHIFIWILVVIFTVAAVWFLLKLVPEDDVDVDQLLEETIDLHAETETEPPTETEFYFEGYPVPMPEVDEQLLTVNEFSRPGDKVDEVQKIVIHYLANPRTSAQQNHDYFESLKDLKDVSMSANYIIGLEGEIIECVPAGEIAYASNNMNHLSVSIENCHLDGTGRFTTKTYESDVHLTAWLLCKYGLERDDIIRHYDVTGKECPLYYVKHEDKWEQFKDDVMNYIAECEEELKK